jgi:hypothetical protein
VGDLSYPIEASVEQRSGLPAAQGVLSPEAAVGVTGNAAVALDQV